MSEIATHWGSMWIVCYVRSGKPIFPVTWGLYVVFKPFSIIFSVVTRFYCHKRAKENKHLYITQQSHIDLIVVMLYFCSGSVPPIVICQKTKISRNVLAERGADSSRVTGRFIQLWNWWVFHSLTSNGREISRLFYSEKIAAPLKSSPRLNISNMPSKKFDKGKWAVSYGRKKEER